MKIRIIFRDISKIVGHFNSLIKGFTVLKCLSSSIPYELCPYLLLDLMFINPMHFSRTFDIRFVQLERDGKGMRNLCFNSTLLSISRLTLIFFSIM